MNSLSLWLKSRFEVTCLSNGSLQARHRMSLKSCGTQDLHQILSPLSIRWRAQKHTTVDLLSDDPLLKPCEFNRLVVNTAQFKIYWERDSLLLLRSAINPSNDFLWDEDLLAMDSNGKQKLTSAPEKNDTSQWYLQQPRHKGDAVVNEHLSTSTKFNKTRKCSKLGGKAR